MSNRRESWADLGPEWDDDLLERRNTAKQREILKIDIEYAGQWIDTMAELAAKELPDAEFVATRITALHQWEKDRKREQKAIHYRYDPLRRSRRLVKRDTDRVITDITPEVIAALRTKIDVTRAAFRERVTSEPTVTPTPRPRRHSTPALHPGLSALDTGTRSMYDNLDPNLDLATAPDDQLRTAWARRNPGMSSELIEAVIEEINTPPIDP